MITNLEFNSLLNEVSGKYFDTQFTMSVSVYGNELCYSDEQYYTSEGDPKLMQPQKAIALKEALSETIYETEEYQSMLRDEQIKEYDYRLNDY